MSKNICCFASPLSLLYFGAFLTTGSSLLCFFPKAFIIFAITILSRINYCNGNFLCKICGKELNFSLAVTDIKKSCSDITQLGTCCIYSQSICDVRSRNPPCDGMSIIKKPTNDAYEVAQSVLYMDSSSRT